MDECEWTPALGLQRAAGRLALRSVIALVIWAAVVLLVTPLVNRVPASVGLLGLTALVLVAPGVAIGYGLGRKLPEIAGMTGVPLLVIACVFGVAVVYFGVALAGMLRPLGDWQHSFAIGVTGLWVTLWLLKMTLLDD